VIQGVIRRFSAEENGQFGETRNWLKPIGKRG
jgi:hypothetical protein